MTVRLGDRAWWHGKQAIVTGAGSGIGAALCRALAAAGASAARRSRRPTSWHATRCVPSLATRALLV